VRHAHGHHVAFRRCDRASHRPLAGDDHDGLVRCAGGPCIGARGGPGFNMAKFLNFFMLISFAYMFVKYYDSSIPGIGYSLKGFISQGTTNLAQTIGQDGIQSMFQSIDVRWRSPAQAWRCSPRPICSSPISAPRSAFGARRYRCRHPRIRRSCRNDHRTSWSDLHSVSCHRETWSFSFWGWFKAYLSFAFYKVVAAATMSVLGHLFITYYANLDGLHQPNDAHQESSLC
jgi:hypothetical protein